MQDAKEICESYTNSVYKYLICLTHDKEIAEELTQDTFYIALKNLKTFREECSVEIWLCKIAKHLWYKKVKNLQKDKKYRDDNAILEEIPTKLELEDIIITKEDTKDIKEKINKLDDITKELIKLRIYGELSFKEIGNIFNKSEVWARVTFYRGKEKIKNILEKENNYGRR